MSLHFYELHETFISNTSYCNIHIFCLKMITSECLPKNFKLAIKRIFCEIRFLLLHASPPKLQYCRCALQAPPPPYDMSSFEPGSHFVAIIVALWPLDDWGFKQHQKYALNCKVCQRRHRVVHFSALSVVYLVHTFLYTNYALSFIEVWMSQYTQGKNISNIYCSR